MAEALLRHHGGDDFEVHCAGHRAEGHQPADAARPRRGRARSLVGPLEVRRRVPRPAVRLRDHRLRRGPPGLPGLPRRPRVAPLGLRGPGRGRGHGGGAPGRVPATLTMMATRIGQFVAARPARAGDRQPRRTPPVHDGTAHGDRTAALPPAPRRRRRPGEPGTGPDDAPAAVGQGREAVRAAGPVPGRDGFPPDAIITSPKAAALARRPRSSRPRSASRSRSTSGSAAALDARRRSRRSCSTRATRSGRCSSGTIPDFSELVGVDRAARGRSR